MSGSDSRELLAAARARLAEAGVDSPDNDARVLLAHALGRPLGELAGVRTVAADVRHRFEVVVEERVDRVPLQHLTGVAGFRYLDVSVGPGVFIPRPETESLVEWAVTELAGLPEPVVVDLCTGSGAIALAIAAEVPAAQLVAIEREPDAYEWARRNLAEHPAGARVALHRADATDAAGCRRLVGRPADLVLSNPPYIPNGARVPPEVARHDPAAALWGGPDGLAVMRGVLLTAAALLRDGSAVAVEHADAQGESVPALLVRMGGWEQVADHTDLAGRPRFTTARIHRGQQEMGQS